MTAKKIKGICKSGGNPHIPFIRLYNSKILDDTNVSSNKMHYKGTYVTYNVTLSEDFSNDFIRKQVYFHGVNQSVLIPADCSNINIEVFCNFFPGLTIKIP